MQIREVLVRKFRGMSSQGITQVAMPNFARKKIHHPTSIEMKYRDFLFSVFQRFQDKVSPLQDVVIRNTFRDADGMVGLEELNARMAVTQAELFSDGARGNFIGAILDYGKGTALFNLKEFQGIIEMAIGTPFYDHEPWLEPLLTKWADENYELIKSMTSEHITRTNSIIEKAVRSGTSYKGVMDKLRALDDGIDYRKAKLIARDQIGKLNGQLNEARQTDAGIDQYHWDTSGDERVRGNPGGRFPRAIPSHYMMDQVLCQWEDASVMWQDSLGLWVPREARMPKAHPGQEIQCRCSGIPYMDEIFTQAANDAGIKVTGTKVPAVKQSLAILDGYPSIPGKQGKAYSALFRDYYGAPPIKLPEALWGTHGKKGSRSVQQLVSGDLTFSPLQVKTYILAGIPSLDPIRAYVLNGKTILLPGEIEKAVAWRLLKGVNIPLRTIDITSLRTRGIL